jgi:hypothetical protein
VLDGHAGLGERAGDPARGVDPQDAQRAVAGKVWAELEAAAGERGIAVP